VDNVSKAGLTVLAEREVLRQQGRARLAKVRAALILGL